MHPSTLEFIRHISDEIDFCLKEMRLVSYDDFRQDEKLMRAVVRSLEVIGEATKKIPADFKALYPMVEWKSMAGMRDRLIHNYFAVDYEIVYRTVQEDLPELHEQLAIFLQ